MIVRGESTRERYSSTMALTSSDLSSREQPYWDINRGSRGTSEHRNLRSGCLQSGTQHAASPTGFSASLCLCVHRSLSFRFIALAFLRAFAHAPLPRILLSPLLFLIFLTTAQPSCSYRMRPLVGASQLLKNASEACAAFHSITHLPSIPWYQVLLWAVLLIL